MLNTSDEFLVWRNLLNDDLSVGFVPTMGAIHSGHLSLIKKSKMLCDVTVVSIFLNPRQFSENEDLSLYPQDIENDKKQLKSLGVDIVYLPSIDDIYSDDDFFVLKETNISKNYEGKSRPLFFDGVITVVAKLFNLVQPSKSFFGKKDAQQLFLISKMVKHMKYPVEIVACETIREHNGLAMSSRNRYFNDEQYDRASIIYESLLLAKKLLAGGEKKIGEIKDQMASLLSNNNIKVDYISIVERDNLSEVLQIDSNDVIVLLAVFLDGVRLIDNVYCSDITG